MLRDQRVMPVEVAADRCRAMYAKDG